MLVIQGLLRTPGIVSQAQRALPFCASHKFTTALRACTCLEDVRVHGADSVLQHGVLVPAVKVVKEMYVVQRVLALHGKVNAVLAQNYIFFLYK